MKAEGLVLFLVLLISPTAGWSWGDLAARAAGFDVSDTCGFTRQDALTCIKKYVDENHDGKISCEEFQRAKLLYMPPRARAALWVAHKLGMDVQFDQVLYGCDANHDCIFTEVDWIKSEHRCLPGKADLCKLKTACDVAEQSTEEYTNEEREAGRQACAYFTPSYCHKMEAQWARDDALAAYLKHKKNGH